MSLNMSHYDMAMTRHAEDIREGERQRMVNAIRAQARRQPSARPARRAWFARIFAGRPSEA